MNILKEQICNVVDGMRWCNEYWFTHIHEYSSSIFADANANVGTLGLELLVRAAIMKAKVAEVNKP